MPRKTIDLPYQVEYLSILDEENNLDAELEPDLGAKQLLTQYRLLRLARHFDERMLNLQRQGRIGTFAPVKGQEAAQIGSAAALRETDWVVPSYRETAAILWRSRQDPVACMVNILLANGGYYQGNQIPEDQHDLPIAIPVSSQTLTAVGIGYGIKYREQDDVVLVYFGDGATSQGDFHEALNFAGVWQVPVIFLCQNNQWAISLPRRQQTQARTLAQKGLAYGIPGLQVDGNDVLAVHTAVQEAVDRARAGDGPSLIECVTYRLSLHTTADDPTRYRDEDEVEKCAARDPLPRFQTYLQNKELIDDADLEALTEELQEQIQTAVDQAESQMADLAEDPLSMFEHIYTEMPPYLREQREALATELAAKESTNG
ncbi:MAG: pyruvate dehydrogenase (acetyl-transferring) E1 component subunit alpha [Anaerolineales bacterium]|nr:pyruvate dehydrogenase (acetyl-transferring) E1 component subunit alpha [Anaerolineales bacterium]